ncbi:hypothetical protein N431DRAFT_551514 [Stipitochalara longipes BDJ]|nr:hypothetical protein N431DRAFT_551514 [Stipitochalara longipes BDJ]
MPNADGIRGKLPQESSAGQLSGDIDYIRKWLVHTHEEANQKRSDSRRARQKTLNYVGLKTDVEVEFRYPIIGEGLGGESSRRKRKHHTSSDSSLLQAPIGPKLQPAQGSNFEEIHLAREEVSDRPQKKRRTEAPVSERTSSISSTPKQEIFERRARHKTREDRYEPKKKVKKRPKDVDEKQPRKKKEKRGDRKEAAKKAGEDLVRNFSSKSIGQERLTIRPSQGLGLFKNGRASSPLKRRGIPDLAFSEMDFLQRSGKHISSMKEDKIRSMSRDKEKRKAARAQDEISTFFKPKKVPMQPTSLNKGSISPPNQTRDRRVGSSDRLNSDYSGQQCEPSHSFNIPTKSSLDFGRNKPILDIFAASVSRSPVIKHPENVPNSTSKLSGKASTYISWSETQISQETKSRDWGKINRTRASSTPESIRRSLEKTGVFRDTGIDLLAHRAGRSSRIYERLSECEQIRTKRDIATSTNTSGSTEGVISPAPHRSHEVALSRASHQPALHEAFDTSNAKNDNVQVREGVMKRERLVIEHFDPKLGWHEKPKSGRHNQGIATTSPEGEIPAQSKSAPIDRLERAQLARVDRPSTTVPLPRPLLSIGEATAKSRLDGHVQTNTDQETNQHTSLEDVAEVMPSAGDRRLLLDLRNQSNVQMQRKEPDQSVFLPPFHSKVNEQTVYEDVRTKKEVQDTPHIPKVRLTKTNHEGSVALHKATDVLDENNSSHHELPVRGFSVSRGISEIHHQNYNTRSSMQTDSEPYFIHQLQRHLTPYEPLVYGDHLGGIEYEELDIITQGNSAIEDPDFQRRYLPGGEDYFFTPADDYIDNASQQPSEVFGGHGGRHLESESWNLRPSYPDMASEHYQIEELGQENYEGEFA